ncbi:hypothetical protein [Advenella faeciporci]|uniref:hypothetical protein n=1 Tax=Advenella faeciporci TaxID=797535 RepID=UPI0016762335|nr:hypothetical protein [Advenella faeciporci]
MTEYQGGDKRVIAVCCHIKYAAITALKHPSFTDGKAAGGLQKIFGSCNISRLYPFARKASLCIENHCFYFEAVWFSRRHVSFKYRENRLV